MTTYTLNNRLNGIEITFSSRPASQIRESLKAAGFRWHKQKGLWYAKQSAERLALAQELTGEAAPSEAAELTEAPRKAAKAAPVNKFGVVVGDIFWASWGYEQTNVDFFQVIELVGTSSVRVREVYPQRIAEEATCAMAANRTYNITREILPAAPRSTFIKDQERGDLKRLKSYYQDGSKPCFNLSSYASADYLEPGAFKTYESWYY